MIKQLGNHFFYFILRSFGIVGPEFNCTFIGTTFKQSEARLTPTSAPDVANDLYK